ncbi:SDR family NAD(P)-dependent oxidoreductase [Clostridium chromiireducens]|uniref:Serine 3-dehydrogenase n=1 Tax=Clostridium chromiireducens TaxID=225345 RepID=A0A1V4ICG1_9CLOT|nr:SDR family NAD(P)-dependent oxidoreductase [Clostridium chromiireducens]OPJ57619.1 serine 3-dehydrogenase [Clostridium chromiireducens]
MNTVLITGTTSGIGEAFAKKFVLEGYNVILVARNHEKLRLQAKELSTNRNIKYITCDLNNENYENKIYVNNINSYIGCLNPFFME